MKQSSKNSVVVLCTFGAALLIVFVMLRVDFVRANAGVTRNASGSQANSIQLEIDKQKQRLTSTEVEERRDALLRLKALNRPEAARVALGALNDLDSLVRATAASALSALPPDESATALIPLLNDKDEFVRREAAYALGHTMSHRAVPGLIERLNTDKEDGVRGAAATALGRIGDEAAVVALTQVLSEPRSARGRKGLLKRKAGLNEYVLRAAARSLGQIGSRAGVPALITALATESLPDDVRREAARSLGVIGDPSSVPALKAAMLARDPYLSRIAYESLRKIAPSELKTPS
jgi:HEAT repeat protein